MITIDLNCDLGEGSGCDEQLMPLITSANIACGGNAGDEESMRAAIRLAKAHRVAIGAHPSFPDRQHFGRREMELPASKIKAIIVQQIAALQSAAATESARIQHVKPHGALYNMSARDASIADAIAGAVCQCDPSLTLVGLAGSQSVVAAQRAGLRVTNEFFADRRYRADGSLVPRSQAGATIEDEEAALAQVLLMLREHRVVSIDGKSIPMSGQTICVHGDGGRAVAVLKALRTGLEAAGVSITCASHPSPASSSDGSGPSRS